MKTPKRIQLANIPTPVHEITFQGKKVLIKRDDLTGMELSGNKVRKLEYILIQAIKEKADIIFTCGGEQSNHARATAIACAKLGLKSKLFLWGAERKNPEGNLFFDKLLGSDIVYLNKNDYSRVNEIMLDERKKLLKKGINAFVIPEGGSTTLGIWGYISFVDELSNQVDLNKLDGILTAAGSGGTAAGLLLGAALSNLKLKIYAVNVLYSQLEIRKKILTLAEAANLDFKLHAEINPENLIVVDGFSTEGYKNISANKLQLIKKFFTSTGILLDPAYTGKAFAAYHKLFLNNKNNRVIFLHSGGLFGVFAKRKKYLSA